MDVQGNDASHKPDGSRRSVQTGVSDQGSEKKVTDHKTGMESRPMPVDNHKPDTEKTAAVLKATADPSPVQGDVSKTDGTVLKETHQNLIPGGEKFQSMGVSYTGAPENLSSPVKQTAAFQQGPLPAAVVNQVGREIAAFVRRGDRFFTLQLKPPELGIVNIEMDVKENALKMSVVTETSSAKDLLHANYVDLKRVLEGYGIRVEAFDVQLNGSLNHASANGDGSLNQQHSQTGMGKNLHFGKSSGETAEENNVGPPVPPGKNSEALLDLLA
jgi:flagellar hook-length control protein FliK